MDKEIYSHTHTHTNILVETPGIDLRQKNKNNSSTPRLTSAVVIPHGLCHKSQTQHEHTEWSEPQQNSSKIGNLEADIGAEESPLFI